MENTILWFRYNLRLHDNESLISSLKSKKCYPIFIHDTTQDKPLGEASLVWLHHALKALSKDLNETLSFFSGDPKKIIPQLVKDLTISTIYYEDSEDPSFKEKDKELSRICSELKCQTSVSHTRTIWDHHAISTTHEVPFKVFSPFFRKGCLKQAVPQQSLSSYSLQHLLPITNSQTLGDIIPLPQHQWVNDIIQNWDISELGAQNQWKRFFKHGLSNYKSGRNYPFQDHISRLSPYIHFGQLSVRQLYHEVQSIKSEYPSHDCDHFISELGWRDFSYYLLNQFPDMTSRNLLSKFDHFPWGFDPILFKAWCDGKTGYPIVDAGMRELYKTGYMHNRSRMVCASFLVKNLMIHWTYGEKWFWNCLFDADHANNIAGWQWAAGCGADGASYFRIFNPTLQAKKFDPDGAYILKYIPELKGLPSPYLHEPWTTPSELLTTLNIELGKTYPHPIVDFNKTRDFANNAFEKLG